PAGKHPRLRLGLQPQMVRWRIVDLPINRAREHTALNTSLTHGYPSHFAIRAIGESNSELRILPTTRTYRESRSCLLPVIRAITDERSSAAPNAFPLRTALVGISIKPENYAAAATGRLTD